METLNCIVCHKEFKVAKSRIGKAKFCSKSCHNKHQTKHEEFKPCGSCGSKVAINRGNRRSKVVYCNDTCLDSATNRPKTKTCKCCHSEFKSKYRAYKDGYEDFCSKKCKDEYLVGANSPIYIKDGKLKTKDNIAMVRINGDWKLEHRVIVERELGRKLNYNSEPILHINGDNSDNRLCNLYLCENYSEMSTIINNSKAPYPVKTNIKSEINND